ncbi:hypothetical protein GFC29_1705 [Anoxybacillus sp. B7M1]|jgi:uncharacterized protein (TIGR00106 family)|uniref:MTH1187 family thiamine-binding protein n=1 Tax=Anoxybacteroides rupiense TaxID=311460 RepID=A0ABD5ISN0_9BACL|nr:MULTISPECIES: MTH1187 family thiamine-binding protein [Anoxybacillus]ANB56768.1 hypothetical protein GFC28_3728 [Anoxybacillus sp. B2M1]ANB65665.1 hypothetical protein GFC29_1705 [Anoxybacillus sp. B7M1]KXG11269.1 hypothetical protein AT864_00352 [Anoxybacillus sp. P3H1B]MBB3906847.1 uncharacterized protein (TIGR00106 family) [Anoxybacillus rupiensis]MBS2770044.1 MTH1187 family thiamine-binding protein [Anoxybacillus rupiensis]
MAIVDVTVIPIGTQGPSVSEYVAEIQKVLEVYKREGKIDFMLTPMNTIIEGELSVLFEVIQAIHEVPFSNGIQRVATNIRIDDRRDKKRSMAEKVTSVREKLNENKNSSPSRVDISPE